MVHKHTIFWFEFSQGQISNLKGTRYHEQLASIIVVSVLTFLYFNIQYLVDPLINLPPESSSVGIRKSELRIRIQFWVQMQILTIKGNFRKEPTRNPWTLG
jgi:hypothetical protein